MNIIKPVKVGVKGIPPSLTLKDHGYFYSKFDFYVTGDNLMIRMSGKYMETLWHVIKDFRQYTSLQVITEVDWGRHWEDGIQKLWHEMDLDLGYVKRILRPINQKERSR